MDFLLGEVTRDHEGIDWFAWTRDAEVLAEGLLTQSRRTKDAEDVTRLEAALDAVGNASRAGCRRSG